MPHERDDLGALLHRLATAVAEHERPLLDAHDLQMWDYVVLSALQAGATPTQNQLAASTGRDKTRLIPVLDGLQDRGLVERRPDPSDRRNRMVTLTPAGRSLLEDCRRDIRAMEQELLAPLGSAQATAFVRAFAIWSPPPVLTTSAPPAPTKNSLPTDHVHRPTAGSHRGRSLRQPGDVPGHFGRRVSDRPSRSG